MPAAVIVQMGGVADIDTGGVTTPLVLNLEQSGVPPGYALSGVRIVLGGSLVNTPTGESYGVEVYACAHRPADVASARVGRLLFKTSAFRVPAVSTAMFDPVTGVTGIAACHVDTVLPLRFLPDPGRPFIALVITPASDDTLFGYAALQHDPEASP